VGTLDSPWHRMDPEQNRNRWFTSGNWTLARHDPTKNEADPKGAKEPFLTLHTSATPTSLLYCLGSQLRQARLERKLPTELLAMFHNYVKTRTPYAGHVNDAIDVLIADRGRTQNISGAGPPPGVAMYGLWSLISDPPRRWPVVHKIVEINRAFGS